MTPHDFAPFFRAVHGIDPFPWQERMAAQVTGHGWMPRVELPTGSGKSAVIDVAVFALACQAGWSPKDRTAALRTFFVVDRRVVVQQATLRARKLAEALSVAQGGILAEVADRLRSFGGEVPLLVRELRGGMYAAARGVDRPDQPLVTVTTVDQIGSRLLFRGYGVSPKMRPVHAALGCLDALYLLDEAQLSWVFASTIGSVAKYAAWGEEFLLPVPRVVTMSATLPQAAGESFRLDANDVAHEELGRRLRAGKRATLVELDETRESLEASVVRQAQSFAAPGAVIGVVVSRVAVARRIFESLRSVGQHAVLLTGRSRPYDRDGILRRYESRLFAESRDRSQADCLFVVATQTVEVGADFDFDALVTDLAPLPAILQRFGRLNRRGRLETASAAIVRQKDPGVYDADSLKTCWSWLRQHAEGRGSKAAVDMSALRLEQLRLEGQMPSDALPRAPAIPPRFVELWAHTSAPAPHPDPDISPYLHGDVPPSADVSIVWRADITAAELRAALISTEWLAHCTLKVSLSPPRSAEAIQVPIWEVRAWLANVPSAAPLGDVEGAAAAESDGNETTGEDKPVLCWRGDHDSRVVTVAAVRPGDVLVVPVGYGGADEFGWRGAAAAPAAVTDIADAVATASRRPRVRLHPALLGQLLGATAGGMQVRLRETLDAWNEVTTRERAALLDDLLADPNVRMDLRSTDATGGFLPEEVPRVVAYPVPPGGNAPEGLLLWSPRESTLPRTAEEGDPDLSDAAGKPLTLRRHTHHVMRWTRQLARAAGLPPRLIRDVRLAALLHDIGKAEPRFQVMLHGGDPFAVAVAPQPIAKSGMDPRDHAARHRAWRASGLPLGLRHEFVSASMLSGGSPALRNAADPDLVIYLIGTHHGYGRPFPPVVDDATPTSAKVRLGALSLEGSTDSGLERIGSGWVERFWRLNRRYGFWGLALLETILRTADWQASREEGGEW